MNLRTLLSLPLAALVLAGVGGCVDNSNEPSQGPTGQSPTNQAEPRDVPEVVGQKDTAQYESLADGFGEAVVAGDWAGAYGMTTASFRKLVSQDALKKQYETRLNDFRQMDKNTFTPTATEVKMSDLPANPADARDKYRIMTETPMKEWRAWVYAHFTAQPSDLDPATAGMQAGLLIVNEGGELKIDWVDFGFPYSGN